MNHNYKIIEDNDDPKQVVIEKDSITARFTLQDMESEQKFLEKHLKEFYAQRLVEDAKMKNIEANHPFVKDMSEQDCFTVHMYQESRAILKALEKKIPEFEEQLENSKEEEQLVIAATGLQPKSNEEIVDEAVSKIIHD